MIARLISLCKVANNDHPDARRVTAALMDHLARWPQDHARLQPVIGHYIQRFRMEPQWRVVKGELIDIACRENPAVDDLRSLYGPVELS